MAHSTPLLSAPETCTCEPRAMGRSTPRRRASNISPTLVAQQTHRGESCVAVDLTRHRDDIVRYLRWQRVPPSVVDELTQDVFLVAHRRREEFRGNSSVKTWLTGIAFHLVLNWRRRRKHREAREVFEGGTTPGERGAHDVAGRDATPFDALDELLAKELCARITEALDAQPEVARRLWLMVIIDEVAVERAASELGLSEYQARQVYAKTAERVQSAMVRQMQPQLARTSRGGVRSGAAAPRPSERRQQPTATQGG